MGRVTLVKTDRKSFPSAPPSFLAPSMSVAVMTQSRTHQQALAGGNIKKQLRDTQRLLSRPTLPADVRREQERKLAALQIQSVEQEKSEKEKKMVTAYRMVRFFERKKAERHLKQALKSDDDATKEKAIMDLNYILHFPKDRKYISLFPTTETTDDRVLEERRNIRDRVNQEIMAKANVQSILEAPLPVMEKAAAELENAEFKVKKALAPGHKDSESDVTDSQDEESEEDSGSDDDSQDDSEEMDSDDDNSGFDSEDSEDGESGSDEFDSEEDESDEESGSDDDSNDDSEDDSNDDDESDEEDDESDDFDSEDDESDDSEAPSPKRTRQ